jgi:plasmid stabilization system protein ParE
MPTYVLSDEAVLDLTGIIDYIAERNVTAALKMLGKIEETCQMLAENPGLGETRQGYSMRVETCERFSSFSNRIKSVASYPGLKQSRAMG